MNNFEQGDAVFIISKKTFGIVDDVENGEITISTIQNKKIVLNPDQIQHCPDEYESECDECCGTGEIDVLNCHTNSNECCGACFKTTECDECSGTGMITKLISENT